jgi:hypothetical protein
LTFAWDAYLGEYLFILLEGFYRGHASLKTSPPLGVSLMRKRVHALENFQNRKEKR